MPHKCAHTYAPPPTHTEKENQTIYSNHLYKGYLALTESCYVFVKQLRVDYKDL